VVRVLALWDGGLVLYGALGGAALGYFAYDFFVLRKHNVSTWKMIDIIAPCLALSIALGRIGCLFTGCCYGNVCTEEWRAIHFPLSAPATDEMIRRGHQTPLGFLLKERSPEVEAVESGSAADNAGLKVGDVITTVNGKAITGPDQLVPVNGVLTLGVLGSTGAVTIAYAPTSIGVNPTQIYETISMCLLLFFLLSYLPYRRRDGEMMVLMMVGYGVHRFLNEMLRTDTEPVWGTGLTLSQNVSIGVLIGAALLAWVVWRRPPISEIPPA